MERSIQITKSNICCLLLLICVMVGLTGCNSLQPSYLDEWNASNQVLAAADMEIWRAKGMADSLCVVENEAAYNDDLFQSEAVGIFNITTGETVYCKNALKQLRPASMTKLMTLYVAVKYGDLDEIVTFPEEAHINQTGVQLCRFQTGDQMTLRDLLYAMILYSGNDAAKAVALHFSDTSEGKEPTMTRFIAWMNEEAQNMGATSTHFQNPHGLDVDGHVSTVYDMYLILYHCIQNETIREFLETYSYEFDYKSADGTKKHSVWSNTNGYVSNIYQAPTGFTVFGGKTGVSNLAGYCLAVYSQDSSGNQYISVVMNAPDRETKYNEMNQLMQMALDAQI